MLNTCLYTAWGELECINNKTYEHIDIEHFDGDGDNYIDILRIISNPPRKNVPFVVLFDTRVVDNIKIPYTGKWIVLYGPQWFNDLGNIGWNDRARHMYVGPSTVVTLFKDLNGEGYQDSFKDDVFVSLRVGLVSSLQIEKI